MGLKELLKCHIIFKHVATAPVPALAPATKAAAASAWAVVLNNYIKYLSETTSVSLNEVRMSLILTSFINNFRILV